MVEFLCHTIINLYFSINSGYVFLFKFNQNINIIKKIIIDKYKLIIFQTESTITPLPKEDIPQQPETSNLDMSATCTLPRCGSFQQNKPTLPTR